MSERECERNGRKGRKGEQQIQRAYDTYAKGKANTFISRIYYTTAVFIYIYIYIYTRCTLLYTSITCRYRHRHRHRHHRRRRRRRRRRHHHRAEHLCTRAASVEIEEGEKEKEESLYRDKDRERERERGGTEGGREGGKRRPKREGRYDPATQGDGRARTDGCSGRAACQPCRPMRVRRRRISARARRDFTKHRTHEYISQTNRGVRSERPVSVASRLFTLCASNSDSGDPRETCHHRETCENDVTYVRQRRRVATGGIGDSGGSDGRAARTTRTYAPTSYRHTRHIGRTSCAIRCASRARVRTDTTLINAQKTEGPPSNNESRRT